MHSDWTTRHVSALTVAYRLQQSRNDSDARSDARMCSMSGCRRESHADFSARVNDRGRHLEHVL